MADFIESGPVNCPTCGLSTTILYADKARQLGNWKEHNNVAGFRCPRSRKKVLSSKYRGR